jgi:hypothetical protein
MRGRLKLPQPSTAIATLALFVALGGTSYAVTGGTPYSTVRINGSQLKDRSVSGVKLEKHTVTGAEIDVGHLPQVPSARSANQAHYAVSAQSAQSANTADTATTITGKISGNQVTSAVASAVSAQTATNATSAQTATSANSAQTAVNATSAQNATNAQNAVHAMTAQSLTGTIDASQITGSVAAAASATNATSATTATSATYLDGDQFANIDVTSGSSSDVKLVSNIAGLTIAMRCISGSVYLDATTAANNASYGIGAVANGASKFISYQGNFSTSNTDILTVTAPSQVSFSYAQGGQVASGTFTAYDAGGTCSAFGTASYS